MTEGERELRRRCTAAGQNLNIERMPFVLNKGHIFLGDSVAFAENSDIQFSNI